MSLFYVERQCWQRWPKVLIMVCKGEGGEVRKRYVPERTCHIIDVNESGVGICDRCGGYAEAVDNYCPNCGARVKEENE